ncbi:MAG: MGMT family protein, partial [Synergistaceae bacterium]|nr:MGMT family protein [Synergistaceae bacterium]
RKIPGMSPQAVGRVAANNKILIMIPCHRVIGSNGNLTGYSGGLPRKLKLLELEGVDIFQLSKH